MVCYCISTFRLPGEFLRVVILKISRYGRVLAGTISPHLCFVIWFNDAFSRKLWSVIRFYNVNNPCYQLVTYNYSTGFSTFTEEKGSTFHIDFYVLILSFIRYFRYLHNLDTLETEICVYTKNYHNLDTLETEICVYTKNYHNLDTLETEICVYTKNYHNFSPFLCLFFNRQKSDWTVLGLIRNLNIKEVQPSHCSWNYQNT